ncbi:MAG: hypothetical protein K8T91_12380 [Planctomycetes bacterium]|nr:hypothetical protein [Planctomycetota bacterium]
MGTPAGVRRVALCKGELHVMAERGRFVLQMRRATATEVDLVAVSAKMGVELDHSDVVMLLGELAGWLGREASQKAT